MHINSNTWALVLAAGDGTRLRTLTTTSGGLSVPKQFCSLRGGRTLIEDALQRARAVAPGGQICAAVSEAHRRWWELLLGTLPAGNVFAQPENRGTAHGILLPLLEIAAADPDAIVVVLPSDHYVRDEAALASALREAVGLASADRGTACLLGVEPDEADTELGYIVPSERHYHQATAVLEFVEKPVINRACALLDQGALWNVFILAGSVQALLALYGTRYQAAVARLRAALGRSPGEPIDAASVAAVYRNLPTLDFSRNVLEGQERLLRVLRVPDCGWTDLGTLPRVARALYRLPFEPEAGREAQEPAPRLNLALQHSLLKRAGGRGALEGIA